MTFCGHIYISVLIGYITFVKVQKKLILAKMTFSYYFFYLIKEWLLLMYRLTRLVEVYDYKDGMTLISELATGGELLDVVTCNKYITEIEVARIIQQILEGVEYMHSKSIGHLGLTPLDILFSRPGGSEIKICDFSLARRIVGIVKLEYGQPEYVSPEIVNGEGASFASDLWAVGIITYLLLSGVSPFRGQVRTTCG